MKNIISNITEKMISYFGNDVRRINHALKVYSFSKSIGELENLNTEQMEVLEISSILHDIGIKESEKKYNSSSGSYQEIEGPPIAKKLLKDVCLKASTLERICFLIGNHHSYQNIDDIDIQILIESDFLVNAYEDNLDIQSIKNMKSKYFKTSSGINFLTKMYFNKN